MLSLLCECKLQYRSMYVCVCERVLCYLANTTSVIALLFITLLHCNKVNVIKIVLELLLTKVWAEGCSSH